MSHQAVEMKLISDKVNEIQSRRPNELIVDNLEDKTQRIIFLECLGAIATEALLENITTKSKPLNTIDWLHESFPNGLSVFVEFERPVYNAEQIDQLRRRINSKDSGGIRELLRSTRPTRIVLKPKESGPTKDYMK